MRGTTWTRKLVSLLGAGVIASMIPMSPAGAATQTHIIPLSFSGNTTSIDLVDVTKVCDECIPDDLSPLSGATGYGGQVQAHVDVTYEAPANLAVSADDALLEEGTTLDVKAGVLPLPGTLKAHAVYNAGFGFFNDGDGYTLPDDPPNWSPVDAGPFPDGTISGEFTTDGTGSCVMPLPGQPPRTCSVDLGSVTLIDVAIIPLLVDVKIDANLRLDVTLDANGFVTIRHAHINAGNDFGTRQLDFNGAPPATIDDPIDLPCGPAGKTVVYEVGDATYDTGMDVNNKLVIQLVFDVPIVDDIKFDLFPLAQIISNGHALSLTSNGGSVDIGQITKDATPPSLAVNPAVGDKEGQQIQLSATADDGCGTPTLAWKLSDGGTAYGPSPTHKFADDGSYTGQVTATDFRGNTTTKDFGLSLSNVAPTANAGPDTTAVWGVPVPFNGSATDPGSADQSTLSYTWTFGDGTPSASGGPSTTHVYANSGDYTATLVACDDEGACSPASSRTIHITKRSTTTAYTGAKSGGPNKIVALSASVTDQLGNPVPGRTVKFTIGTQNVSATTGTNGVATTSLKITQKTGTYTVKAETVLPVGEPRYTTSSDTVGFVIGSK